MANITSTVMAAWSIPGFVCFRRTADGSYRVVTTKGNFDASTLDDAVAAAKNWRKDKS